MAACPVCQSELEISSQHHGTLFTCPRCNAVFFVDWNGQPEGAPAPSESEPESLEPIIGEEFSPPTPDYTPDFPQQAQEFDPEQEEPRVEESAPYDFSTPDPYGPADPTEPVGGPESFGQNSEQSPAATLSEITDFGNADVTHAAFNYSVIISGIDSAAIYAQVKEALTDSKFGWNIIQVMTQMKDGVLTIKSVNAVKASILIQRVKYLPVKVSWRQDVLSSHV